MYHDPVGVIPEYMIGLIFKNQSKKFIKLTNYKGKAI